MRFRFSDKHQHVMVVLRQTREAAGIGQRELSKKLGRVYNYANLVENGQTIPTVLEFVVYVRACGVKAGAVMDRVDELLGPLEELPQAPSKRTAATPARLTGRATKKRAVARKPSRKRKPKT